MPMVEFGDRICLSIGHIALSTVSPGSRAHEGSSRK